MFIFLWLSDINQDDFVGMKVVVLVLHLTQYLSDYYYRRYFCFTDCAHGYIGHCEGAEAASRDGDV